MVGDGVCQIGNALIFPPFDVTNPALGRVGFYMAYHYNFKYAIVRIRFAIRTYGPITFR